MLRSWSSAIAWENFRARLYPALEVESGGFSEGAYGPLPERSAGA